MRIAILAPPTLDPWRVAVVQSLAGAEGIELVGALVDARPGKPQRQRLKDNLRRGRGGYVLVLALRRLTSGRGGDSRATQEVLEAHGAPVTSTTAPYAEETLAGLRALRPDALVLLGGFGIVKAPMLEVAPGGVLSYHHGDMRRYRGQPPGFWELYNGEPRVGVTVQRLHEELDAGEPVLERSYEIRPGETPAALRRRLLDGSADMMLGAVRRVQAGEDPGQRLDQLGDLYTLPNLRQWLTCHVRVARRARRGQRLSDSRR